GRLRRVPWRDLVPRPACGRAPVGGAFSGRAEDPRHGGAALRPRADQPDVGGDLRHRVAVRAADARRAGDAVRYLVLVPEALMLATAVVVMLLGRFAVLPSADRKSTRLNSSHVSISYAVF